MLQQFPFGGASQHGLVVKLCACLAGPQLSFLPRVGSLPLRRSLKVGSGRDWAALPSANPCYVTHGWTLAISRPLPCFLRDLDFQSDGNPNQWSRLPRTPLLDHLAITDWQSGYFLWSIWMRWESNRGGQRQARARNPREGVPDPEDALDHVREKSETPESGTPPGQRSPLASPGNRRSLIQLKSSIAVY